MWVSVNVQFKKRYQDFIVEVIPNVLAVHHYILLLIKCGNKMCVCFVWVPVNKHIFEQWFSLHFQ